MKLEQSIKTAAERIDYLNDNLTGEESSQELVYAANYILFAEKDDSKAIITDNRNITVTKRESSFEGICSKLENGENGIYNLISNLGKQAYLTQKTKLTEQDYEEVPGLKEIRNTIDKLKVKLDNTPQGQRYQLKKQLKELYQLQYVLKAEYTSYIHPQPNTKTIRNLISFTFDEKITITEDGDVVSDGAVNLFDPLHISSILCNYSKLKADN